MMERVKQKKFQSFLNNTNVWIKKITFHPERNNPQHIIFGS